MSTAVALLNRAKKMDPAATEVHHSLAIVLAKLHIFGRAEDCFIDVRGSYCLSVVHDLSNGMQCISLDPSNCAALQSYGIFLASQNHVDDSDIICKYCDTVSKKTAKILSSVRPAIGAVLRHYRHSIVRGDGGGLIASVD